MPINIQPLAIEIIVRLSGRGISRRDISRITGMLQGDYSKVLCRVHDTSSFSQGLCGHRLKPTTWKEDHVHLRIMNRGRFLSASTIGCSWSGELDVVYLSAWSKSVLYWLDFTQHIQTDAPADSWSTPLGIHIDTRLLKLDLSALVPCNIFF